VIVKTKSRAANSGLPDILGQLDDGHREILLHLDQLIALVGELRGAPPDEKVRRGVRGLIAFFSGPAREHNYDEELHVFPRLLQSDDAEVKRAAETLCEDHAWIEFCWLDIEPQLAALAAGAQLSDVAAFRSATETFVEGMRDHIGLEESLLYPQLRGRLNTTQ
jgi:hemerythrin-like domain-containing protein